MRALVPFCAGPKGTRRGSALVYCSAFPPRHRRDSKIRSLGETRRAVGRSLDDQIRRCAPRRSRGGFGSRRESPGYRPAIGGMSPISASAPAAFIRTEGSSFDCRARSSSLGTAGSASAFKAPSAKAAFWRNRESAWLRFCVSSVTAGPANVPRFLQRRRSVAPARLEVSSP